MKAITFTEPGGPEVLQVTDVPDPQPNTHQLLVRVHATALNRADLLQRRGQYPPPPGESDILGLELAGEIEACGKVVQGFTPGENIVALVGGGGYAELAVVDYRLAMKIPEGLSFNEAAAIPEAFFTAQETVLTLGGLQSRETVLIHAAGSGVGTAQVQMAKSIGAYVLVTAGTTEKLQMAAQLGADAGCNYQEQDFAEWVQIQTEGKGVNLVVDPVGAANWQRNFHCLTPLGRLVLFGLMSGQKQETDLRPLLTKRLTVKGTVLRNRSVDEKIAMTQRFVKRWLAHFARGTIRPVIDSVFPITKASDAHRYMEANRNIGKIVLDVRNFE